jgi:hypothetical protein
MSRDSSKGCLLSAKIWIIALILGGGLFVGLLILIDNSRPPRIQAGAVTAALTVIPSINETITPTSSDIFATETSPETPTIEPGSIGVGVFVQVSGTGGDGLRLRKGPGLEYEMQFLGLDGELFQIGDGPVDADGYTWWFVVGSYDETRQGWAAADFLEFVPNP